MVVDLNFEALSEEEIRLVQCLRFRKVSHAVVRACGQSASRLSFCCFRNGDDSFAEGSLRFSVEKSGSGDGINHIALDDNVGCVKTDASDFLALLQILGRLQRFLPRVCQRPARRGGSGTLDHEGRFVGYDLNSRDGHSVPVVARVFWIVIVPDQSDACLGFCDNYRDHLFFDDDFLDFQESDICI